MSIDQTTLAAQLRDRSGKGVARRLRGQSLIPAVVYGPHSEKPLTIAVDPKALREAIKTPHRLNTILTLKLDGGGERVAMLKTYQQDPVTRSLLHADFYEVRLDEPVTVPVPVALVGKPEGAAAGGILQQNRRELEVVCLPKDIPERIEVDVSHLKIAQALHVSDVKAPAGVKLRFATDFTVAIVAIPEKEEVVAPVAAAAAAVPGAAAAPAEAGKAPAPGAAPAAAAAAPAAAGGKAAPAKK
jgi:large subunit ribosomal protein L25